MKEKWQHIKEESECPDMEQLIQYFEGKLAREDRFIIENHLASCDICNDTLEGLALMKDKSSLASAENELKDRVNELLFPSEKKRIIMPVYRRLMIAASILLVAGLGFYLYTISRSDTLKQEVLAVADTNKTSVSTSQPVPIPENIIRDKVAASKGKKDLQQNPRKEESKAVSATTPSELAVEKTYADVQVKAVNEEIIPLKDTTEIAVKRIAETELSGRVSGLSISENKPEYNQPRIVSGIVKDQSGAPIVGASIRVAGSGAGTITDANGKFRLALAPKEKQLEVSFVGFKSENIDLADNSTVDISLKESLLSLQEVVVTGHGTRSKRNAASSISNQGDYASSKDKKVMSNDSPKNAADLAAIDSLKLLLKNDPGNISNSRQLAAKYLKSGLGNEALEQLNYLKKLTSDTSRIQELNNIIKLTNDGKFARALKRLNSMNF